MYIHPLDHWQPSTHLQLPPLQYRPFPSRPESDHTGPPCDFRRFGQILMVVLQKTCIAHVMLQTPNQ